MYVEGLKFFVDFLVVYFTEWELDETGFNVELLLEVKVLFEYSFDYFFDDEIHNEVFLRWGLLSLLSFVIVKCLCVSC